jgi:hypothetical protein
MVLSMHDCTTHGLSTKCKSQQPPTPANQPVLVLSCTHDSTFDLLVSRLSLSCLAGQPPVLVLSNGQFEMTAHIAAVLNHVYARHKHHEPVANIIWR